MIIFCEHSCIQVVLFFVEGKSQVLACLARTSLSKVSSPLPSSWQVRPRDYFLSVHAGIIMMCDCVQARTLRTTTTVMRTMKKSSKWKMTKAFSATMSTSAPSRINTSEQKIKFVFSLK